MGKVIELIAGQATAPGAIITAITMAAGLSNVVRSFNGENNAMLISLWTQSQAVGIVRIISPRLANNNQGIHFNTVVANENALFPFNLWQKLYSQDTLGIGISGSAGAGDFEAAALLVYYPDLPGSNGNFISIDDLNKRATNLMTNRVAVTAAAGGGFTGQVALNATENMFKANKDYALIGYQVSAACAAVRMIASDLGNIGIGGPGIVGDRHDTGKWFYDIADKINLPLIPVINASNVGGILVDVMQDENAAAVAIDWTFVELD